MKSKREKKQENKKEEGRKLINEHSFHRFSRDRHFDHCREILCVLAVSGIYADCPCPDYHRSHYAISMGFIGGIEHDN